MTPIFIKEFLPKQILNIAHQYCITKYTVESNFEAESSTKSIVGEYADYFMETLLELSTPVIEKNVGKKLYPTYSYLRIYDKLSDLPVHTDRAACEYTVALAIGCNPDEPYSLFVGEHDDSSPFTAIKQEGHKNNLVNVKIDHQFDMMPNDAVIFQGLEKIHWRNCCHHDYFITVFLHYVDQEGEYADFKFDKRKFLGESKK